jgi:hypothetical protein
VANQFLKGRPDLEGAMTCEEKIKGCPQTVDVGPDVDLMAVYRLLGGHVVHGAYWAVCLSPAEVIRIIVEEASQAQIEDLDSALPVKD